MGILLQRLPFYYLAFDIKVRFGDTLLLLIDEDCIFISCNDTVYI